MALTNIHISIMCIIILILFIVGYASQPLSTINTIFGSISLYVPYIQLPGGEKLQYKEFPEINNASFEATLALCIISTITLALGIILVLLNIKSASKIMLSITTLIMIITVFVIEFADYQDVKKQLNDPISTSMPREAGYYLIVISTGLMLITFLSYFYVK